MTLNNLTLVNDNILKQFGKAASNKDGIIEIIGLDDVVVGEVLSIGDNSVGQVINIESQGIKAIVLGDDTKIIQDDLATPNGTPFYVPVGESLLGRIVDCLGNPMDSDDKLTYEEFNYIEAKAPGIITRKSVHESLATGILAIDGAISIGRGQRELIIGDRQTGKTTIAIDTIINHRNLSTEDSQKLYCIYVAIGQRLSSVVTIVDQLKSLNAFDFVTVVSTTAAEPASLQYLAPYTGYTMGEFFRDNQTHASVVYRRHSFKTKPTTVSPFLHRHKKAQSLLQKNNLFINPKRAMFKVAHRALARGAGANPFTELNLKISNSIQNRPNVPFEFYKPFPPKNNGKGPFGSDGFGGAGPSSGSGTGSGSSSQSCEILDLNIHDLFTTFYSYMETNYIVLLTIIDNLNLLLT